MFWYQLWFHLKYIKYSWYSNLTFWIGLQIYDDSWDLTRLFNMTALIIATLFGQTEIVELLLEQEGIDANIKNSDI